MCGASLNERPGGVRVANYYLRDRMGLECISEVMQRGRLRWFGHVKRMGDGNWVKEVRSMNVGRVINRGRPRKHGNWPKYRSCQRLCSMESRHWEE